MSRSGAIGIAVLAVSVLTGCVSAFPDDALRGVNRELTLSALRADPAASVSQRAILGGEILATQPRVGDTEIEVLGRRLRSDDSPERSDRSDGRFLVRASGFLDPAVYAAGRRITVVGTVVAPEDRPIGALPYRYPVIASEGIRLWPKDVAAPYPPPYLYDPYGYYWGYGPLRPYRF
jgi:outer membrane lipoprotein